MAHYHPSDDILIQFSAGALIDPLGIQIACHLEFCTLCREKCAYFDSLGAVLMQETQPEPVSSDMLNSLLNRLDEPEPYQPTFDEAISTIRQSESSPLEALPKPLRRLVPCRYEQLPWYGMFKSIQQYDLPITDQRYVARFYKIAAGKKLPKHTHRGNEYTLVLQGSFHDQAGTYQKGDFILADSHTVHQPTAASCQDCICFAVMDAPLKLVGLPGLFLNRSISLNKNNVYNDSA